MKKEKKREDAQKLFSCRVAASLKETTKRNRQKKKCKDAKKILFSVKLQSVSHFTIDIETCDRRQDFVTT